MRFVAMRICLTNAIAVAGVIGVNGWVIPSRSVNTNALSKTGASARTTQLRPFALQRLNEKNDDGDTSPTLFQNPFEAKIPEELRDEIYKAEANTPAAQQRGQRIATYTLVAIFGVLTAFFNYFLSELRAGADDLPGMVLSESGFAWVEQNFLTSFLLLNKLGGIVALVLGIGSALLAETEADSKRVNAEKIYEELVRRRELKTAGGSTRQVKRKKNKKKRSGKELKRLTALSEVIDREEDTPAADSSDPKQSMAATATDDEKTASVTSKTRTTEENSDVAVNDINPANKDDNKGLIGQIKEFYQRADSMAASQALLLNKKLEDAGVLEKITDETGLKVVGKDAPLQSEDGPTATDSKNTPK